MIGPFKSIESIQTWGNEKAEWSKTNQASLDLHQHVSNACDVDLDNHEAAVIRHNGKLLSIRWSDHNTLVTFGHKIENDGVEVGGWRKQPLLPKK